jgi:hypothetical protein
MLIDILVIVGLCVFYITCRFLAVTKSNLADINYDKAAKNARAKNIKVINKTLREFNIKR